MKRLYVNSFFLFFIGSLFLLSAKAQVTDYSSRSLHAHNDYQQPFPFWQAYQNRFGSIEVDIFLQNGQLLVAHEASELDTSKTLEKLYLQPLLSAIKTNHEKQELILLIDIKTEAIPTLQILIELLKNYPEITGDPNLKLTISGNQPEVSQFQDYPSFIWFDANPEKVYPIEAHKRLAIMSANFKQYSKWNGKGKLTREEILRLDSVIQKAKTTATQKMRFWNAPDTPNAWYQLMKLKVGLINTDHIVEAATFMKQLPKNSFQSIQKQITYTPSFLSDGKQKVPKNIILLVADGMGLAHLHAGYTANKGDLTIFKLKNTALSLTASHDSYITDSAPGATAFHPVKNQ